MAKSTRPGLSVEPPLQFFDLNNEERHPTLGELYETLGKMKDHFHLPVWLGVEAGEGFLPFQEIVVDSAKYADLDGDEVLTETYELDPEEGKTEESLPKGYRLYDEPTSYSQKNYHQDIVLIGPAGTKDSVQYQKQREAQYKQDALERAEKAEAQRLLEQDPEYKQMKALEKSLKAKGKLS